MSEQPREPSANSETADGPADGATEARGDTSPLIEYLFSQLDPHPCVEPVPLRFTPIPLSEWSEYMKRCRDEIKGAARPKGWLWCGIPQD